jgi:2-polyprenyl-3-methyl-5-hydroxy-6-metoxy-1,4-benzoquinol methylase
MWIPRFACPECGAEFAVSTPRCRICDRCGQRYERRDEIWRFLTEARAALFEPFIRQYRLVRAREGYRVSSPDYYRDLPHVAADHPHAAEWRIRRETYEHLQRDVVHAAGRRLRVLDVGAGNGWLSHRLASQGHEVAAVDAIADSADGLGAARHYDARFLAVEASFDALPFAPGQFDLVVFNGSLHYACDVAATLRAAWRMLVRGGVLAVMDSPMFDDEASGEEMVGEMARRFETAYGIADVVRTGAGYLTFASLAEIATALGGRARFVRSRGPVTWRVGRQIARLRLGRAPAAFGLWITDDRSL